MVGIEEKLDKLPVKPGVYIMKNEKEEIIYVGKAISLRNRVRQYFQPGNNQGLKVKNMVKNIDDFEYIIVDNEVEALILEANLIKKHKPKYNILLRDDKQYPYIKVTLNEKFPRVVKTREVKKDKAKYYGPYPSATAVNDFLEIIHNIYPIRTCKLNLDNEENIGKLRPCLNYFINRCKAPCQGFIEEDEYNVMISEIMKFLAGNKDDLIDKIQRKMTQASKDLEFEKAASYRDQLISLNLLQEEQKIVSTSLKDQDVIGLARGIEEVCIQIFFIRAGKIVGREHFLLEDSYGSERGEILSSFIKQFYMGSAYIPKEIIIDTNINDFETVEAWLSDKKESKVEITVPQRGDKVKLVEMVNKNARDMLDKYGDKFLKKHRENIKALEEIQYTLGLENLPKRIEAYDISNISGMQAVGSMVVFENGEAKRSDYRRFKIKSLDGKPDDYSSMNEVLSRRFIRGIKQREKLKDDNNISSFTSFPDLLMIDGGKGQVNVVKDVLKRLGLNIEVCGLVKDDKHDTRGIIYENEEYILNIDSLGFRMIYKIQEEAHRFAISYHRTLRDKNLFKSQLDGIKGIGEVRKRDLMKHFKSIEKIKNASLEELLEVESMNTLAGENLIKHFKREEN